MSEFILSTVAVILTVLVLSRIAGDNPAYRFTQYLFIGVSLGYAVVVAYHQVLRPLAVNLVVSAANPTLLGIQLTPLVLGLLLFARLGNQRVSWLANLPLALLFGVGAALVIGGALTGTLGPQILDTVARPFNTDLATIAGNLVLALGVVLVLSSFYFVAPSEQGGARQALTQGGRWLLIVSFGVFFAGAVITYLSALVERVQFIVSWVQSFLS